MNEVQKRPSAGHRLFRCIARRDDRLLEDLLDTETGERRARGENALFGITNQNRSERPESHLMRPEVPPSSGRLQACPSFPDRCVTGLELVEDARPRRPNECPAGSGTRPASCSRVRSNVLITVPPTPAKPYAGMISATAVLTTRRI